MGEYRAGKAGINAEAQARIHSKYNDEIAQETLEWIRKLTGEPANTAGDAENFYAVLKDGTLLCKLVNSIQEGSVKKINQSSMAFKCMENINAYLEAVKKLGVPAQETFQTIDLWEKQNLYSVVTCLQSLGRKAGNFGKPSIGPKEADKNVREFTEEQMKAGQNVISLQYGTNAAQQSGISFGNKRQMWSPLTCYLVINIKINIFCIFYTQCWPLIFCSNRVWFVVFNSAMRVSTREIR